MIIMALIVIVLLITLAALFMGESGAEKGGALAIGLVISGILMIVGSLYQQDPGESVVIQSAGGKILKVDETPGWGATAPWNKTHKYNVRNVKIAMHGGEDATDSHITAPLKGSSNARVSVTITYSLQGDCVGDLFLKYRTQERLEKDVLIPGIRDVVRLETANYEPLTVKEKRGELSNSVFEGLVSKFEKHCVTINNVDLGDISLDDNTEAAIVARNQKMVEVESAMAELEKAQVSAEAKKVAAKADADADQIVRCGAKVIEGTRLVDGKEIAATEVVPLQGAECENRLNEQVLEVKRLEALQAIGAAGNMVIVTEEGSNVTPMIQVPQG